MKFRPIRLATLVVLALTGIGPASLKAQTTSAASTAPELDQLLDSKESGLLTEWRLAGPFGSIGDLSREWQPEHDQMRKQNYSGERVVSLQFPTGKFALPAQFRREGVFYASSDVWLPNGGDWRIYTETQGGMIVFIDGMRVMQRLNKDYDFRTTSEVIHLEHGNHRVLVKFVAAAAPFHLAVMPQTGGLPKRNNKPRLHETAESQYTSAELHWPE